MLLDHDIVPQTVARPGSFTGLMALYESNYLRLLHVIPELRRLDGYYRSYVAGDCNLQVEILDRSRHTVTMSMSYLLEDADRFVEEPEMTVRAYLDGKQAEALDLVGARHHDGLRRLFCAHRRELNRRWRLNIILNKWLEYLLDQGHLILER